ncbi:unnamed protein product [Trichobilharzia szidati]|nr:unnamed protein product [Trichobilharzia szidati]
MLIYSELLTDYTQKDNQSSKCDRLSGKEKRLPRFALSEKNKNRLLYGNRVNLTPDIDSFATNSSEIGTMIHSYRLPMFPTLFSKSENTHDQHTSRINKTSEDDDTDSNNSQNTLASVVHSPDNSVKHKDKKLFNDQFSINNVTSSTTTIKNHCAPDHKKCLDSKKIQYDEDLNMNGLNTSKDYTHMKKWMETRGMETPSMNNKQNSWKSDSSEIIDLSNRARQIDRLFGELSRKMYCLSEENGFLLDNLFTVTEHLKYFKNILQDRKPQQPVQQNDSGNNTTSATDYSSYENSKSENSARRLISPYQNIETDTGKKRFQTTVNLRDNVLSQSQPNLNQDVNYFNHSAVANNHNNRSNIDNSNTPNDSNSSIDKHKDSRYSNKRYQSAPKKSPDTLPGYTTKNFNSTRRKVQKNNNTMSQSQQANKIPQILTRANRFSTMNLTASLFRGASKERPKKRFT